MFVNCRVSLKTFAREKCVQREWLRINEGVHRKAFTLWVSETSNSCSWHGQVTKHTFVGHVENLVRNSLSQLLFELIDWFASDFIEGKV